ncbi:hypothetical protein B5E84_09220 [Lachnoclostridium sp. An14]|nr:hypothetical protein B5E84_09220 [Lachnoclostridium sp. An14]
MEAENGRTEAEDGRAEAENGRTETGNAPRFGIGEGKNRGKHENFHKNFPALYGQTFTNREKTGDGALHGDRFLY